MVNLPQPNKVDRFKSNHKSFDKVAKHLNVLADQINADHRTPMQPRDFAPTATVGGKLRFGKITAVHNLEGNEIPLNDWSGHIGADDPMWTQTIPTYWYDVLMLDNWETFNLVSDCTKDPDVVYYPHAVDKIVMVVDITYTVSKEDSNKRIYRAIKDAEPEWHVLRVRE